MRMKIIVLLAVVALVTAIAAPAFASADNDAQTLIEQRYNAKKEAIDQAVENGCITAEQGRQWHEHFDRMYNYYIENDFICPHGNENRNSCFGFGNRGKGFNGKGFCRSLRADTAIPGHTL